MTVRYCIFQQPNQTWQIIDYRSGPNHDQETVMPGQFSALLDAVHFMFSQGYGEFCISKP